jgi:thioredoxin-like negative regulator of GroEL
MPIFTDASKQIKGSVGMGIVDCTSEKQLAANFKISSFPTIIQFPAGKKQPQLMNKYEGPRQATVTNEQINI